MSRSHDELQGDLREIVKANLRNELGKDYYAGKHQALLVTTNSVTGQVGIDTCNINLTGDAKKMLMEAYLQLERSQMANAIIGLIRKELAYHEDALRSLLTEGNKKGKFYECCKSSIGSNTPLCHPVSKKEFKNFIGCFEDF